MIIAIAVTTEHIAIIQSVMFGLLFITFTSENFSAEKRLIILTPHVISATQFLIPKRDQFFRLRAIAATVSESRNKTFSSTLRR